MARPSDYSPVILEKAKDYLANYEVLGEAVPTVAGLALKLGVTKGTIYNWAKDEEKKEFLDTLGAIQQEQEKRLVNLGLNGKFNSVITKLMLANHDYREKQDVTSNGETLTVNVLSYKDADSHDSPQLS